VNPEVPEPVDDGPVDATHENEIREAVVSRDQHGLRLDKLLVSMAPEFSRGHLQALIDKGHVLLDGKLSDTASRKLRVGQKVALELVPTDESQAFRAEPMALTVLFEDEYLLVINKPAGLVVHPAAGNWSGTLLNGLLAHHAAASTLPRAGIVHRLDKDTSGLMVVGKTVPAVTALVRAIAARDVHRRYLAIARGTPREASFTVDAPIGRDPSNRTRMAVVFTGKAARTDVELLATKSGCSALSCTLHTGRTHQIRVHLAYMRLPLVADLVYGGKPLLGMQRQALHATELRFVHPVTGAPLAFDCPPPPDFAAAWKQVTES
jgi:23S rRNA pseudouridine1911/1915/1917 synthase